MVLYSVQAIWTSVGDVLEHRWPATLQWRRRVVGMRGVLALLCCGYRCYQDADSAHDRVMYDDSTSSVFFSSSMPRYRFFFTLFGTFVIRDSRFCYSSAGGAVK